MAWCAGSPKHLMVWIPGWYWLNMALTSAAFLFVSYRVFQITVVLRDACIPKDLPGLGRSALVAAALVALFYGAGYSVHVAQMAPPITTPVAV